MKTIEEWRIELNNLMNKNSEEAIKIMCEVSEEIVIAFCAKYKLNPEEAISVYQGNKFWVEKIDESHIQKISNAFYKRSLSC